MVVLADLPTPAFYWVAAGIAALWLLVVVRRAITDPGYYTEAEPGDFKL